MKRTLGALLAPALAASCAVGPQLGEILPSREVPMARASEIVTSSRQGQLEYASGCLYLRRDGRVRAIRHLVIWPLNTRFNGSAVVPGESTTPIVFRIGERIIIDGDAAEWAPHILTAFPQLGPWRTRCNAEPLFVASIRRAD